MTFIKNPNFERELTAEGKFKGGLAKAAEPAAKAAKAIAPVGTIEHMTKAGYVNRPGDYRDSIRVLTDPRLGVVLTATDWKAHWIEWGSVNNPPSAPLRRGVRAAGLRLRESSK